MLTSRGWRVSPLLVFVALVAAVVLFLMTNGAWDAAAGDGLGSGVTTSAVPTPTPSATTSTPSATTSTPSAATSPG